MACVRRTLPCCVACSAGAKHQACCAAQPMQVCVDRCAESWPGLVGANRWQRGAPGHRQDESNGALVANADAAEGKAVLCPMYAYVSRSPRQIATRGAELVGWEHPQRRPLFRQASTAQPGRWSAPANPDRAASWRTTSSVLLGNFLRLLDRRHAWSSAPSYPVLPSWNDWRVA